MAYITRQDLYSCDRCGAHFTLLPGRTPAKLMIVTNGEKRAEADLCRACMADLDKYMRQKERHET